MMQTLVINFEATMSDAIVLMTSKGLGCANVVNKDNKLIGIITDGDLRRFLAKGDIDLSNTVELQ